MSDVADAFLEKHMDENNGVRWPGEESARTDLAQTLLGIRFVGACDYWYEFSRDLVVNPQPEKPYVRAWSDVAKKDRAYREAFATLDQQQRAAVLRLLHQAINGTMYSVLVTLDQFPHANVVIQLVNREEDSHPYVVGVMPGEMELHKRWHQWFNDYSSTQQAD